MMRPPPPLLPSSLPSSLEKKTPTVHRRLVLVIYLQTVSERERERRTVDRSATRYSFYVLWLNQPGYMRTLCPGQRDKLKKWRVIVDEITWKRITPRCGRGVRPRGSTRPSPLPLAAEISRNLIERRRERQWRFTDKLPSLPNEG